MKKLIPVLLALVGLGAGAGAGLMLRPPVNPSSTSDQAEEHASHKEATDTHGDASSGSHADDGTELDAGVFMKLNNQFIIPVVNDDEISSLVAISLSLEVDPGANEIVFQMEPKITDVFLQVMFNHANHGGFDGVYTQSTKLAALRRALLEAAKSELGDIVRSVLVTNIVRQDS